MNTIMKVKEARRLAKLLEQEIKKEISTTNIEDDNRHLNTESKNTVSAEEKQEGTIKKQPIAGKNEIGPASVQRIELQETTDAVYEVVTVKSFDGNTAVWKNPVLMKPRNNQTKNISSHQICAKSYRNTTQLNPRSKYYGNNLHRIHANTNEVIIRKNVDSKLNTLSSENVGSEDLSSNKPNSNVHTTDETPSVLFETVYTPSCANSGRVSITNLSYNTSSDVILHLANEVGAISSFLHDQPSGRADLKFSRPEEARQFYMKCHRKMIDLSIIKVAVDEVV